MDHFKHLLLTIFTCGLWLIGWAWLAFKYAHKSWRCCFCRARIHSQPSEDEAASAAKEQKEHATRVEKSFRDCVPW
jgi:hypothetical protein